MSAVSAEAICRSNGRVADGEAAWRGQGRSNIREEAFLVTCSSESLPAIIAAPEVELATTGVLVVVGGPQYRVGSHRQFVQLSRSLAEHGVSCMRFDYRGMGDGSGAQRDFESIETDIRAAIDVFLHRQPSLQRVVLWGLCDGASAACLYAPTDVRVAGLVLLNPWVRTPAGEARTQLRHYYLRRLVEPAFWRKLFGGGVALGRSFSGLIKAANTVRGSSAAVSQAGQETDLPSRMANALQASSARCVFFLSDRDYVAREFESVVARSAQWRGLVDGQRSLGIKHFTADHTFSTRESKEEVVVATLAAVAEFERHDRSGA